MDPRIAKNRIKSLLLTETELQGQILQQVAKIQIQRINKATGKDNSEVSDKDICDYINAHYSELLKDADAILDRICDKAVPEKTWWYILKNFTVFSFILALVLIPLFQYIAMLLEKPSENCSDLALCFIGVFFLFVGIVVSIYSMLFPNVKKNQ